jgi:hypothetical protein
MASLNDQISEFRDELKIAREEGRITPEGQKMLDQLDTKSWSTGGFGQFLQGLSLNFSDQAIGAFKSFLSPAPAQIATEVVGRMTPGEPAPSPRDVATAMERIGLKEYSQEYPVRSIAANIAGGATPAIVTRGRAAPSGLPAQIGIAAAAGATAGLGESEAELFSPESMKSAAIGGGIALGVLPIAKVVGMGTGSVYRGVVKNIFDNPQRLGTDEARSLIKQALVSDVGGVDEAVKFVLERKGKPYALADVGPNTRAYLDAANSIPGPGKKEAQQFLSERDKGMLSRLTSDLQVAFGSKAAFFDEFNALKKARSDLGGALYDRALKKDVPVTSELVTLMERPSVQDAYKRAVTLAQEQGVKLPDVAIDKGRLVTADGKPVTSINSTFLHFIKMGLDDVVFTGKSPTSGIGTTQLNAVKDTRTAFLNQLDAANPTYKNARRVWASDTAVMDAMEEGRTVFNKSPKDVDILLNDIKTMSRSEVEALRLGVMQNLLDRLGGAQTAATVVGPSGNPALKIINDPKNMRILRETFPKDDAGNEAFSKFINNLKSEVEMKSTSKQVLQGSQTAERTQAIQDVRAGGQAMREMPAMSVQGILMRALQRDYAQLGDSQTRAVADEMTRILTTTDPKKLQKISKELAGRSVYDVVSKDIPELLPALGRAVLGPYSIGSMSGNVAPNVGGAASGLLGPIR